MQKGIKIRVSCDVLVKDAKTVEEAKKRIRVILKGIKKEIEAEQKRRSECQNLKP
jgi:hypothetical protein